MRRELVRIWRSLERRFRDPENNPMSIPSMLGFYLRKQFARFSRRRTCLQVPFNQAEGSASPGRIAVIVHCFYPDLFPELLESILRIPYPYQLHVSTDTPEKAAAITAELTARGVADCDLRLVPNRGRDIAPKYVTFRDVYAGCDYFLHLHSKKSPHGGTGWGDEWRRYLLHGLLGSREIVASNLALLRDSRVGLVFPEPFDPNLAQLRWGRNFEVCRSLAQRLGLAIAPDYCPDYPTGSMFWAKSAVVQPLLDLQLNVDDFAPERGQLDGDLSHAIERMIVPVAQTRGLHGIKIVTAGSNRSRRAIEVGAPENLAGAIALCLENERQADAT